MQKMDKSRRVMASLAMLVSWDVWKERNTLVFRNHSSAVAMVVARIKEEAAMWSLAGAKALTNVILSE
jgi:hypothetical protein